MYNTRNCYLDDSQWIHLNCNFPKCSYEGSLREMVMIWIEDQQREDGSYLEIVEAGRKYTPFIVGRNTKPYDLSGPFNTEPDAEEAYYQHCKKFALNDPDWFFYTEVEWQEFLEDRELE